MKKKLFKIVVLLIFTIGSIIFGYNDYFLYKTPILKVTNVEVKLENDNSSEEKHYIEDITGIIKNGNIKGKVLKVNNSYSESLVYNDKIDNNSELLVELSDDGSNILNIISIKRDKYIIVLLVIFIDLIILIAGNKGVKTLISLILNVLISAIAIVLYINNYLKINMLILYFFISIIFIIVSLLVTNGKSKKILAAILSSIVSLLISFSISFILIKINEQKIFIWTIEYIEAVNDYYNYLYVSILLCGLGAIMDISITISSALNELIIKNYKITKNALIKSGKEISKDIVGTMINVMLFTCYTSVIPTIVLATRNNMSFTNALDYYGNLELMIVLCTCIGIVLTIPISLYISLYVLKNDKKVGLKNE